MIKVRDRGIDVGIVTNDIGPMIQFYGEVIGLQRMGEVPLRGRMTMHRFECGASTVKVIELERAAAAPAPGGIAGGRGIRYITIGVADLDDAVSRCVQFDVRIVVPATETPTGAKIAIVEDPDGNWVEFLHE